MEDRIAELEATVRDLQARLQLNSTNSSEARPSDPIGLKRKPPTPPSSRKRGGQPGHRKAFRPLVPPELPRIEPVVDEFRLHRLTCPDCGTTTCGTLPEGVPTVRFGPYLQATLAGVFRLK